MTSGSIVSWRLATNGLRVVIVVLILAAAVAMKLLPDNRQDDPAGQSNAIERVVK